MQYHSSSSRCRQPSCAQPLNALFLIQWLPNPCSLRQTSVLISSRPQFWSIRKSLEMSDRGQPLVQAPNVCDRMAGEADSERGCGIDVSHDSRTSFDNCGNVAHRLQCAHVPAAAAASSLSGISTLLPRTFPCVSPFVLSPVSSVEERWISVLDCISRNDCDGCSTALQVCSLGLSIVFLVLSHRFQPTAMAAARIAARQFFWLHSIAPRCFCKFSCVCQPVASGGYPMLPFVLMLGPMIVRSIGRICIHGTTALGYLPSIWQCCATGAFVFDSSSSCA